MQTTLAIICLIGALNFQLAAQTPLSEKEIVGTWHVVAVHPLKDISAEDSLKLQYFKDALLKSNFYFKADHHFTFDFEPTKSMMTDVHWEYDEEKKVYLIQQWEDRDKEKASIAEILTQ